MSDETADTITLDRNRPFAIVTPPENGMHTMQDNFYFNAQGRLVESALTEQDRKRLDNIITRKKADRAASEAYAKVLEDFGVDKSEIDAVIEQAKAGKVEIAKDDNEVDIRGWAMGAKKYVFGQVRSAMLKQYSVSLSDKNTILNFLVDQGHMREDEIGIRGGTE